MPRERQRDHQERQRDHRERQLENARTNLVGFSSHIFDILPAFCSFFHISTERHPEGAE